MPSQILGIDPGTRHCGWGIVRAEGARVSAVAFGVFHLDEKAPLADRLVQLDDALQGVLEAHSLQEAAVETLFFAKDPQAASKLGHARGAVLLRLRRHGLPVFEYAPTQVKQAISGRGHADKLQMAQMIAAIFRLTAPPPSDAADALAIALVHARAQPLRRAIGPSPIIAAALAARRKVYRRTVTP